MERQWSAQLHKMIETMHISSSRCFCAAFLVQNPHTEDQHTRCQQESLRLNYGRWQVIENSDGLHAQHDVGHL